MTIASVCDRFSTAMFTNVHGIVHDSFLPSVKRINPVRDLVYGTIKFWGSWIFVNNWAILIFVSVFLKCLECSVSLARWRSMDTVCFQVVHEMLISSVNVR